MKKFILVRHGQSEANARREIAHFETPLTDEGKQQARQTANEIKRLGIKTIACSPMSRARQTAEEIAKELGVDPSHIKVIDELKERFLGDFEGKPREHEPEYYFLLDNAHNIEPAADVLKRSHAALRQIKELSRDGLVVVIGHSVAAFYLRQAARGKTTVDELEPPTHMKNADFIEVAYE